MVARRQRDGDKVCESSILGLATAPRGQKRRRGRIEAGDGDVRNSASWKNSIDNKDV